MDAHAFTAESMLQAARSPDFDLAAFSRVVNVFGERASLMLTRVENALDREYYISIQRYSPDSGHVQELTSKRIMDQLFGKSYSEAEQLHHRAPELVQHWIVKVG